MTEYDTNRPTPPQETSAAQPLQEAQKVQVPRDAAPAQPAQELGASKPPRDPYYAPPAKAVNGTASAAFVFGILSIVFAVTLVFGLAFGIIAIVLGSAVLRFSQDGLARAGKICGIIGVALSAAAFVLAIVMGVSAYSNFLSNPMANSALRGAITAPSAMVVSSPIEAER